MKSTQSVAMAQMGSDHLPRCQGPGSTVLVPVSMVTRCRAMGAPYERYVP